MYQQPILNNAVLTVKCFIDNFRLEYKQVAVLRSLLTCPVLVLTATATETMRKMILVNLLLSDSLLKSVAVDIVF